MSGSAGTRTVPGAVGTMLLMAGVTWTRLLRGRALWVALVIVLIPILAASTFQRLHSRGATLAVFTILGVVLAILTAMFVASAAGEDIEDKTATYLWSRPVPRWAVFAGKLLTLVPVTAALVVGSWVASFGIMKGTAPPLATCGALAAMTAAMSLVSLGIGSLAPRHAMSLTLLYMFFESIIGALPATIHEISVGRQGRVLAGFHDGSAVDAMIALAVIGGLWAAVAAWRIKRLQL